jgi:hypothetical protein
MPLEPLTPELVREMARVCGIDLEIERAKNLIPALEPVFDGDAKISSLDLGTLTAIGNPWPEVDGG